MSETNAFFDERAELYDRAYDAPGADGYALRSRMAAALRFVGDGPGEALDAGMGPGRLLAELDRRGWTVTGVDASAEMVDTARRRLPSAADRLLQSTIEDLPFPDAAFDVVVATGVLEYAGAERAIPELARVLRPGGLAVLSYPNPRALYGIWKTRAWYPAVRVTKRIFGMPPHGLPRGSGMVRPEGFEKLLTTAKLIPTQTEYTSFLAIPSPLDDLLPRATEALGMRLEGSRPQLSRHLAAQVVYAARKVA